MNREERFVYVILGTILLIVLLWLAIFHILINRPFDKLLEFP